MMIGSLSSKHAAIQSMAQGERTHDQAANDPL